MLIFSGGLSGKRISLSYNSVWCVTVLRTDTYRSQIILQSLFCMQDDWHLCLKTIYCSFHISLSKTFWLYLFYFHDVCQHLLYNQEQNFSWVRQKTNISPLTSIIKIAYFCNIIYIDMTLQKRAIFIMGVYGEFVCLCLFWTLWIANTKSSENRTEKKSENR